MGCVCKRGMVLFFISINMLSPVYAIDEDYKTTLYALCDALISTQITDQSDQNYGALVCPSRNPDVDKIHSRSAEAVYPFAVAYKHTNQTKYRDAAIMLGNWLVTAQESSGAWNEDWPAATGWMGTTADQLISMAGALPIVISSMSSTEISLWNDAIVKAADYVVSTFPLGNVNYNAVGAAALKYAHNVVSNPNPDWLTKADDLMNNYTLNNIITDNILFGEGKGVDQGYTIAQSIGYIALYAILTNDNAIKQKAVDILYAHYRFVYPNGSVDNSWGTRSYKFGYESGTKTAPGVHFSFALLADVDPKFNAAGLKCLEYCNTKAMDNGWITYGPHAYKHASSTPPCNYLTFTRGQSIALAIEYGPDVTATAPFPAQETGWYSYYSALKVTVVRTEKIMATVSSYGEIAQYRLENVPRGGSISNLWYEGFGDNGFLQVASVNSYNRTEPRHMPNEDSLLPLTPRVESTISGTYYANLYETEATMDVVEESDNIKVTAQGKLTSGDGTKSSVNYTIINRFYDTSIKKEITVSGSAQDITIIEPIVNDPGTIFTKTDSSTVAITPASSVGTWLVRVVENTRPYSLTIGTDSAKYWSPFPGIECYPIIIRFNTGSNAGQTIALSISGPPPTSAKAPGTVQPVFSDPKTLFSLHYTYPSGWTRIGYSVLKNGHTTVRIYSLAGKLVKSLVEENMPQGHYDILWDGTDSNGKSVPCGIYLCNLVTGGYQVAEKLQVK